ncbi:MAG TPA: hypothetical protein DC024_04030, partial [Clostridiales bacterium]|nr:hypothetical protein [Clostridiales bacterium]
MKEFELNDINNIGEKEDFENSEVIKDVDEFDDTDDYDDFDDSDDQRDSDDLYDSEDFENMEILGDESKELILVSDEENKRIDVFISEKLGSSRNSVQKLICDGNITVNERKVKANYKVKINDTIKIVIPPPVILDVKAENIALDIV